MCVKYDSLAVLFDSNGNSYIISMQSDTCVCSPILRNIETMTGQKKYKKKGGGAAVNAAYRFFSPALV